MADRVPVFELHIRPMFRLLDRDHMLRRFDLWTLNGVWENREAILSQLSAGAMPPGPEGGPWPPEWLALFERWVQTGDATTPGHHLELGTARDGRFTAQPQFGGRVTLSAEVEVPSEGDLVWFDLVSVTDTLREYALQREPEYPPTAGTPTVLVAQDVFRKGTVQMVVVNDAQGRHEVAL